MHKYYVTIQKGDDTIKIYETENEDIAREMADNFCVTAMKDGQHWSWKPLEFTGRTALVISKDQ